jgi:hypothetical protein
MRSQRFLRAVPLLLTCLIISSGKSFAQQQQAAPSRLALEVTFYSGRAPAFQTVPPAGSGPSGGWFGFFRRIDGWQPHPGVPPVEAVRVTSQIEGNAVRVFVSTLSGAKALENEAPVTTFLIRENEKNVVTELEQVGVEPFEIRLVRVTPDPLSLPAIDNRAASLVILKTEVAYDSTLPTYKLSLSNQSNKNIIALGIDVLVDGRTGLTGLRRNPEGQIFMAPGKPYQLQIAAVRRAQPSADGYSPASPPKQTILIKGAVFEDGTYEGDAEIAAGVLAFRAGEKLIILRLLPILTNAIESVNANVAEGLKKIESQINEVSTDAEPGLVQSILAEFPQLKQSKTLDIKKFIEVSLAGTKSDLLKDLEKLQTKGGRPLDANTYRESLIRAKSRYEKWLSGLGMPQKEAGN